MINDMAENKKSFIAYCDWDKILEMLSDEEVGRLTRHLFAYVNDRNPALEERILKVAFEPIKLQLKRDLSKYEAISYINNRGLKISKSSIYKKTAEKEVPFQRWGGKKIVFVRQELDEWIENQLSKRENGVIKTVADAARRKERV